VHSAVIDISGQRFGRLTVLGYAESRNYRAFWNCLCDCGMELIVEGKKLRSGHTQSCDCLKREKAATRLRTHSLTYTKEYSTWLNIKQRCYNPSNPEYRYWGGRGIEMCASWRNSFEAFYTDMGSAPDASLSIDRINNDGNYEPGNCRWATALMQARNQRQRMMCRRGHALTPDNVKLVGRKRARCCCICLKRRWTEDNLRRRIALG
jgi:hypothetical protein